MEHLNKTIISTVNFLSLLRTNEPTRWKVLWESTNPRESNHRFFTVTLHYHSQIWFSIQV